jgi:hypothetical protein
MEDEIRKGKKIKGDGKEGRQEEPKKQKKTRREREREREK